MSSIAAFAPVAEPVAAGTPHRHRWHVLGSDRHPATAELRARSATPRPLSQPPDPTATAVLLGDVFGWSDNALLLDGVAAGRRDGGRLVLLHSGAGGTSLLQVAAKEDPSTPTLSVELAPNPTPRAVRIAVSLANADPVPGGELHVDADGRITRTTWRRIPLPPAPTPRGRPPWPNALPQPPGRGSVLVTGGLGGLGVRAAGVLSSALGLHPVLLDLARPDDLPDDVMSHLRRLRGGGVSVVHADVTDGDAVADALAGGDWPPVTAIVHCAGLLRAGPLDGFTAHDLTQAQQVKVDGLHHVLAAVKTERLRHLVTFGSVTAEAPHRSMASYALANELLRRATMRVARELPACATVAAEWSLWSGAGMAHQAAATGQARRMGMTPVSLRDGMAALLRLLAWPAGPDRATPLLLLGEP